MILVTFGRYEMLPANSTIPLPYRLFKQCDPRWAEDRMGLTGTHTVCEVGCLMSSTSMALNRERLSDFNSAFLDKGLCVLSCTLVVDHQTISAVFRCGRARYFDRWRTVDAWYTKCMVRSICCCPSRLNVKWNVLIGYEIMEVTSLARTISRKVRHRRSTLPTSAGIIQACIEPIIWNGT